MDKLTLLMMLVVGIILNNIGTWVIDTQGKMCWMATTYLDTQTQSPQLKTNKQTSLALCD